VKTFLVIEDDVTFSQVLARSLRNKGCEVLVANRADHALSLIREHAEALPITHAVLDLKLAETSGLQLLPQLLAIAPLLQIVVLTGYASVATTVEAIKQGAVNYLAKPASVEEILAAFDSDAVSDEATTQVDLEIDDSPLSVQRVEWEYIQRQLIANNHNIAATARALGMHRRTLQRKLNKRPART
jgi:two-component system response regulator RegA